jgi:hypothetical protein
LLYLSFCSWQVCSTLDCLQGHKEEGGKEEEITVQPFEDFGEGRILEMSDKCHRQQSLLIIYLFVLMLDQ